MAKKNLNIIEISDDLIKVIKTKPSRTGRVLWSVKVERIANPTDEQIARQLAALFKPKETRSEDFYLLISRRFIILKTLKLPSVDEAELNQMLDLQIGSQVPYPRELVLSDHTVIEKNSDGYSRVIVSFVHQDVYSRYMNLCRQAGIRPKVVTFSSVGFTAWVQYFAKQLNVSTEQISLYLNFDSHHSEICFMKGERLIFSRQMKLGLVDVEGDKAGDLVNQLLLSISNFQKENDGQTVNDIKIISIKTDLTTLLSLLKEGTNVGIKVYHSVDGLPCDKALNWPMPIQEGVSVTAAIGLALAKGEPFLKFVEADPNRKSSLWLKGGELTKTIVLSVAAAIAVMVALSANYLKDQQYLNSIEDKLSSINPQVELQNRSLQQLRFIDTYMNDRMEVSQLFSQLYKVTPKDIAFRSISFNQDGLLTLQGFAEARSSVNNLQAGLVNAKFFQDVNLQYASNVRSFNKELTDFKIICRMVR